MVQLEVSLEFWRQVEGHLSAFVPSKVFLVVRLRVPADVVGVLVAYAVHGDGRENFFVLFIVRRGPGGDVLGVRKRFIIIVLLVVEDGVGLVEQVGAAALD